MFIGNHECKNIEENLFIDNNVVITELDDTEIYKAESGMEIHSEAFGFNHTLSVEGSTCEYHKKYHYDVNNCWEKYFNGKNINRLIMHNKRAHYGMCRKTCFISYVQFSHINSLVSINTFVLTLKMFPGMLLSYCQYIEDSH